MDFLKKCSFLIIEKIILKINIAIDYINSDNSDIFPWNWLDIVI